MTAHSSHYHNYSDRLHHKLAHYIRDIPAAHSDIRTMSTRVTEVGELTRGGSSRWRKDSQRRCDSRGVRDNRIAQRLRGRGYCFCWGEPRARASGRHNKRKPEVAADRFAAPLGRGPRKSRQLVEALPRHGTAPDTKHSQTAWRPPVSFVSAPASRRPRRYYPSTDPAIYAAPP